MSFLLVRFNYLQDFVEQVFFPLQPFACLEEEVDSFAASVLEVLALALLDAFFLPNIVYLPYSRCFTL